MKTKESRTRRFTGADYGQRPAFPCGSALFPFPFYLSPVLIPITATVRDFPTRYTIRLQRKTASVALDQIRTVPVERLLAKMTTVDPQPALAVLRGIFAE